MSTSTPYTCPATLQLRRTICWETLEVGIGFKQGERNRALLDRGACESKILNSLVGEASSCLASLSSLEVRAAQVLDLGTTFGILKTKVESEVSISLGVTHKEPIPVELTFGEIHPEDFVNW